jgi:hypothetical protein
MIDEFHFSVKLMAADFADLRFGRIRILASSGNPLFNQIIDVCRQSVDIVKKLLRR